MSDFFSSLTEQIHNIIANSAPVVILPIATVFFIMFFFIYYIKIIQPERRSTEWINMEVEKTKLTFLSERYRLTKRDVAPLLIITAVFLFLAVFNLGDRYAVDVLAEIETPAEVRTHMNNLYFDEIYFVRTAVEHIENVRPFEASHPPLGKEIIAASILTFGMSPLGWRLFGAIAGVLILAVLYIFVKNMFGKTAVATCATLLLGFEFMRFVQSRIGTIDTYTVLFILLSFFFMYRYITTEKDADFRESLAPLALSGFFFGLSFAIKWIGFYAGAGLFIIYVIRLAQLAKHYRVNERDGFGAYLTKTLLFSLGFFVIVPVTIYYLTYIPYGLAEGMTLAGGMLWSPRFLQLVWDNQIFMFDYHSRLVLGAEHPFSSEWWQWLFNIRPVLYVNTAAPDGVTRATFGAFGNPVVYWGGLLAMLVMAVRVFTHRDGKALFILIGYLSQLLPWIAVSRILFAYHYFPGTLFLILALAHVFNTILSRSKRDSRAYVYGYTAITGVVFAIFYPSISGMFMPHWYYSNLIKWLNTWPF